jgi:hypothetical protein
MQSSLGAIQGFLNQSNESIVELMSVLAEVERGLTDVVLPTIESTQRHASELSKLAATERMCRRRAALKTEAKVVEELESASTITQVLTPTVLVQEVRMLATFLQEAARELRAAIGDGADDEQDSVKDENDPDRTFAVATMEGTAARVGHDGHQPTAVEIAGEIGKAVLPNITRMRQIVLGTKLLSNIDIELYDGRPLEEALSAAADAVRLLVTGISSGYDILANSLPDVSKLVKEGLTSVSNDAKADAVATYEEVAAMFEGMDSDGAIAAGVGEVCGALVSPVMGVIQQVVPIE